MALLQKLGRSSVGEDDEVRSIVDNLNNILNSRREFSYFNRDFGISDLHHYNSRDNIAKVVMQEVVENIQRYEPRVELTNIIEVREKDLFRISFRIDCVVRKHSRSLSMVLDPLIERYMVSSL